MVMMMIASSQLPQLYYNSWNVETHSKAMTVCKAQRESDRDSNKVKSARLGRVLRRDVEAPFQRLNDRKHT
jgi:hypothetical protein